MSGSYLSEKCTQEFFHTLLKCSTLSSPDIPQIRIPTLPTSGPPIMKRTAYFCLGDQGKSGKQFRTNIGDPGSLFWAFLLPSRPGQPSVVHVVDELNYGIKRDEEQHPASASEVKIATV